MINNMKQKNDIAVFGGGCFWCTEAIFEKLRGVISVLPGYAGGRMENPTYEQVCSGVTGHAEVIRIEFDKSQISYCDLLTVFFATHDPTTPNRQGNDIGTQYRSIILYTNEDQKREAEAFIKKIDKSDHEGQQIVTEVKPIQAFYEAEEYHLQYYHKNSKQPYCRVVINPKLDKLKEKFNQLLNLS